MNQARIELQAACDAVQRARDEANKPARILFVDDDPGICKMFARLTSRHNCVIDYANDGLVAERRALSGGYDLIILDIGLPHKSGIEVFRTIRANNVTTPVAILTGIFDDRVATECNAIGYADHVRKPDDFGNQKFFNEMLASKHISKLPEPNP